MIEFGLQPEGIDIFDAHPGNGAGVYEFWRNFNLGKYMRMQGLFRRIFSDWASFPGMNANFWSEQYSYDENGNRVEKTNGWGQIDYAYNAENQMMQAGNRMYQYDANGNLNRESLDNDTTRYRHTAENRIKEIEYSQGAFEGTLYYQYDAMQRQNTRLYIPSINNHELYAMEEHYSYLGQGFNQNAVYARELDEDTRQSNGELQKAIRNNLGMTASVTQADLPGIRNQRWYDGQIQTYQHVYNGTTPVLSFGGYYTQKPAQFADTQKGHLSSTSRAYFVHDYQGSVRGVSAAYGNELMRIDYDAFGQTINGYVQNFGYTGKPVDQQSKQYNYGYRHYAPQQARFTTVDPIKDGTNWYSYVHNDPVNFVDPLGLEWVRTGGFGDIFDFYDENDPGHHGEDWKWQDDNDTNATIGKPVPAVSAGTVTQVGESEDLGKFVRTTDENGVRTDYAHLSDNSYVNEGDEVNTGDYIGEGGNTGKSTGPHVHIASSLPESDQSPRNSINKYGRDYTNPANLDAAQAQHDALMVAENQARHDPGSCQY